MTIGMNNNRRINTNISTVINDMRSKGCPWETSKGPNIRN